MGKADKQKRNLEKRLMTKIQFDTRNMTRMVIRRESDDKCIEVNWADEDVAEQIEEFSKGTNGRVKSRG